jgi:hypothetical protein
MTHTFTRICYDSCWQSAQRLHDWFFRWGEKTCSSSTLLKVIHTYGTYRAYHSILMSTCMHIYLECTYYTRTQTLYNTHTHTNTHTQTHSHTHKHTHKHTNTHTHTHRQTPEQLSDKSLGMPRSHCANLTYTIKWVYHMYESVHGIWARSLRWRRFLCQKPKMSSVSESEA